MRAWQLGILLLGVSASSYTMDYDALLNSPPPQQQLVTADAEPTPMHIEVPPEALIAKSHQALPDQEPLHDSEMLPKQIPIDVSAARLPIIADEAIVAALSYDYMNRGMMQQMAMQYFTPDAWLKFMSLEQEKQRRQVVARQAVVHAIPLDAPNLMSLHNGQWMVTMPVVQSFHRQGKLMAQLYFDVNLILAPGQTPGTWLVSSMVLRPKKQMRSRA